MQPKHNSHGANAISDKNIVVAAKVAGLGPKAFDDTVAERWENDPAIRQEFGSFTAYAAFMRADLKGEVKLLAPDLQPRSRQAHK